MEELFHRLSPLDERARERELTEIRQVDSGLGREVADLLTSHDSVGVLDHLTEKLSPVLQPRLREAREALARLAPDAG